MASRSTITAILDKLYAERLRNVGVGQVMVDGVMIRFENSDDRDAAIDRWEGKLAEADGTKPLTGRINLARACD